MTTVTDRFKAAAERISEALVDLDSLEDEVRKLEELIVRLEDQVNKLDGNLGQALAERDFLSEQLDLLDG